MTSKTDRMGLRYAPFCFTEQGIAMLSCVLNSLGAIAVNIQIIRIFIKMREIIFSNQEVYFQIEEIRNKAATHQEQIALIFEYLKQLEKAKQDEKAQSYRNKLGIRPLVKALA